MRTPRPRRLARRLLAAGAAALLAFYLPASAQLAAQRPHRTATGPVYHLLGFSLSGSKRVDTKAIVAALPQHEGDVISLAQIKDDADHIRAILAARHVHGDLTTATLEREGPGHHIWVIWDIHPVDGLSAAPMHGTRHFAGQSFTGNVRLSTETLQTATGLHPGDAMPDGSVGDARTGIEQQYDTIFPDQAVEIKARIKLKKDNSVTIDWLIAEPRQPAAH